MKTISYYSLFLLLIIGGCIQTETPEVAKRVNLEFDVDNMGERIEANQNAIEIERLKMLADKFNIVHTDDALIQSNVDGIVIGFSDQHTEEELVLGVNIGFEDFQVFKAMELFISPPADGDNIQDGEFFGENDNFSLIIKGSYNDEAFTHRSGIDFNKLFEFASEVEVNNEDETLVLRLFVDTRDLFFRDGEDEIINPFEEENEAVIDSLLEAHLSLEAFAADRVF